MCAAGGEQYVRIACRRGQYRRYRTQAYKDIFKTRNKSGLKQQMGLLTIAHDTVARRSGTRCCSKGKYFHKFHYLHSGPCDFSEIILFPEQKTLLISLV